MQIMSLGGTWEMLCPDGEKVQGAIPGSVYSFLLAKGKMEDPYYRDNELKALDLVKDDYTFTRAFDVPKEILHAAHQILRFDGIDTLADITLNGVLLGSTFNMHRTWEYDVTSLLKEEGNVLAVAIHSPTEYIKEQDREYHLGGSFESMRGFSHLRKAHCMFGWDWGPRLPDEGIWKDVSLLGYEKSRITDIRIHQDHTLSDGRPAMDAPEHAEEAHKGKIAVDVTVTVLQSGSVPVKITLTSPDGNSYGLTDGKPFRVPDPKLWWPNGLGDQPLYELKVELQDPAGTETSTKRIGLRTCTIRRRKDEWGESFATEVNGRTFFAMGADYIPEDNVLSRMSPKRTRKLLEICRKSHFNAIRVWGGGFYPFDYFYDLCDEMGFVVWQDMMFACANYRLTDEFEANITAEIEENVRRLRHHPSLGLWCGNNEMESFASVKEYEGDEITCADYLVQNEHVIPQILKREDPDTFYWPSSPSSGGKFVYPQDPNRGDVHYWEVWHGGVPFTEYRKFYFRYLSEFGFQSFPNTLTIDSFTEPDERNIFSRTMEMHQRNSGANGKILEYLSQTYLYPNRFDLLVYASQLLQADAIRYGVEHFRRNRNDDRCMGAIYWQLDDIWPVASWASLDYYYRWKALQYAAVRFFNPVMISCEEVNEITVRGTVNAEPSPNVSTERLCVTNETWEPVSGTVSWELRDPGSRIIDSGSESITVEPFSSRWLDKKDYSDTAFLDNHFTYHFTKDGEDRPVSEGSVLFCAPKHYHFADPHLTLSVSDDGKAVTVTADAFAKSVEVYDENGYVRFDDNFFDLEKGSRTLHVEEGVITSLKARSVYDIR